MTEYFEYRESMHDGWIITPNMNKFLAADDTRVINGSLNLLACRISGLSWPDWLRYCRANGATLYGKKSKYIIALWKEKNIDFLKKLNQRANEISKYINFKDLDL